MKMMYGLLSAQALDFANFFENRAKRGESLVVDVLDVFGRFTADGISTAVMGIDADCVRNEESEIYKILKKLLHDFVGTAGNLKLVLAFAFPQIYKYTGFQVMSDSVYKFLHGVVIDTMNDRDRNNISRPDVIQMMLQAKKGQLDNEIEEKEEEMANFSANVEYKVGTKAKNASHFIDADWIAQGFNFFVAG